MSRVSKARAEAIAAHGDQKYGEDPYLVHLNCVVAILQEHGFSSEKMLAAGYLHDAVEDTSLTVEAIAERIGRDVADLVWHVTDEPGKNRKERKAKTLPKIVEGGAEAVAIKLADRIANLVMAKITGSSLLQMYQKEHEVFSRELRKVDDRRLDPLWITYEMQITPW